MKRGISLLLILLALTINLISAVDIKLSKDNYQPQETLLAEITGNFIETLTIDNLFLYKEGIPRTMPALSDITKFSDIYYVYMVLPNQEGNFSLKIENAKYTEEGTQKTDAITKEFILERTNQSALQINPSFVKTKKDFSIKVRALNENQEITASFDKQTENFSLVEDNEKTIVFSITNVETGKHDLTVNDYTIPVFIIGTAEEPENIDGNISANQTIPGTNTTKPSNFSELSDEEVEEYIEDLGETEDLSCANIGVKCFDNEECDGEEVASSDGNCCIGLCKEQEEKSYGWVWGVLILLVVVAGIAFFILNQRKNLNQNQQKGF